MSLGNKNNLLARIEQCLCPAGNGVHTVKTAQERKEALQRLLYGTERVQGAWLEQVCNGLESVDESLWFLMGICSDTGGGILRGANWGPLCVRQAFYAQLKPESTKLCDIGDVRVIPHLLHDKYLNEETLHSCREALYGDSKIELPVSPLSIAEETLTAMYLEKPKARVLSLGGDHSISYATVNAYLNAKATLKQRVAVVHFDAHTDLLPKRLGIDINFGTWARVILPKLASPADLIQVGIRSSGHDRGYWTDSLGVQQFWSHEVRAQGAEATVKQINAYLAAEGIDEIFLSFDIDVIDSKFVSATGTPEEGGLWPDEAIEIIQGLRGQVEIGSADLAEVAPFTRAIEGATDEPHSTLSVAAQVMAAIVQ